MGDIRFDPVEHRYWDGKKRIPGLSEILRKVGLTKDYTGVDEFYALRGTATHLANELWLKGKLDDSTLDEYVKPCHMAFRDYIKQTQYIPLLIESIFYNQALGYACRIDYYGNVGEKNLLVDAKCSKSHDKGADFQLCMQAAALQANGYPVDQMQILELHDDGTHKPFDYPVDLGIADAIMRLYNRRIA